MQVTRSVSEGDRSKKRRTIAIEKIGERGGVSPPVLSGRMKSLAWLQKNRGANSAPLAWAFAILGFVMFLTSSFARADDFPSELVHFKQYGDKPIFTAAGPGTWEVKIRERGWIHLDPNADGSDPAKPRYRLWYTGYNGQTEGVKRLGYATSKDGIAWTRLQATPIYDQHWVEDMIVLPHKNVWHMFAEGKDDLAQLLTSSDGLKWHREGQLDVRKVNGKPIEPGPYGTPTVWLENGV